MKAGCSHPRFSSNTSRVSEGKNSKASNRAAWLSTTEWMVTSPTLKPAMASPPLLLPRCGDGNADPDGLGSHLRPLPVVRRGAARQTQPIQLAQASEQTDA